MNCVAKHNPYPQIKPPDETKLLLEIDFLHQF